MNKENNALWQETEQKIKQAYGHLVKTKLPEKVTVSDICREAGIHRTTFYGHYCDTAALREQLERDQVVRLLQEFRLDDAWNLERGMLAIAVFCKKHAQILRKHLLSEGRQVSSGLFPEEVREDMEKKYDDWPAAHGMRTYARVFYWAGTLAVLAEWIRRDCPESEREIADDLCRLLRHTE